MVEAQEVVEPTAVNQFSVTVPLEKFRVLVPEKRG